MTPGSDIPDSDLLWKSAAELGAMVRDKKISPVELARVFLSAVAKYNPPLNAIVTVDPEFTLRQAREVEEEVMAGEHELSLLPGVPWLAKDLDVTAGMRTTFGSVISKDYVPTWDMIHVRRMREAGCVLLGKTNTPEDGLIPNTYNDVFGTTRNPWNLERCPGGSSGGAAAAVAAGLAPLAAGSDGAGSIRLPASLCGCFGLKPTFGSIPFGPKGIGVMNSIGHLGPITRNANDARLMLEAMAGPDEHDRTSIASLSEEEAVWMRETPDGGMEEIPAVEVVREMYSVAWSADLGHVPVEPCVREAFMKAIEKMLVAGWNLTEAAPDFRVAPEELQRASEVLMGVEWGTVPWKMRERNPANFEKQTDYVKRLAEFRASLTLDDLWKAYEVRKAVAVAMGGFFEQYDLLLTPTLTRTAFELNRPWPARRDDPAREDRTLNHMLIPFNLNGDPAATTPIGFCPEGLPIGMQIVGPRFESFLVLRAAEAVEQLIGDPLGRRPPHAAGE